MLKLPENIKKRLLEEKISLFRLRVDDKDVVALGIPKDVLTVEVVPLKMTYGIKFILFDTCIALVLKIEDQPGNPCYLDHYLNPSSPQTVKILEHLASDGNFGLLVYDPLGECLHLSRLPLSFGTLAGVQQILNRLPLSLLPQAFSAGTANVQSRHNPEELWDNTTL
ncbi:MAG: hypothetical protein ABIG11_08295 [bacterium]